ncbi:MAG: VanZ family protein [Candidatus Eisenbacteria bacterium]
MRELEQEDVRFLSSFLRLWLPVLGYITLIFALSSISDLPGPKRIPYIDKIAHFTEYGILGLLLGRAFRRSGARFLAKFWFGLAVLAAVAVGFIDEWFQSTVPGRERSNLDLLADLAGVICAQVVLLRFGSRGEKGSG